MAPADPLETIHRTASMAVVVYLAALLIAVLASVAGVSVHPFLLVALALGVVFLGMSFQYYRRAMALDDG